jgi:hypothetical protein
MILQVISKPGSRLVLNHPGERKQERNYRPFLKGDLGGLSNTYVIPPAPFRKGGLKIFLPNFLLAQDIF